MATLIEVPSGRAGYWKILRQVAASTRARAPRGQWTRDLGPTIIVLESPYDALPLDCGRRPNPKIAAAEAVQLIGGYSDPNLTVWSSPNFRTYQEDSGDFYGAYGKRIGLQLNHAINKLIDDPDSRQAVISVWDPDLDNVPGKRDYPCTVAMNFAILDGKLEMRVVMRSNDVWLGLPYDMFQFTQLQLTVASCLALDPGPYTHSAWSLHLYERDADKVDSVFPPPDDQVTWQPRGLARWGESLNLVKERAHALPYRTPDDLNGSERWYRDQFATFMG